MAYDLPLGYEYIHDPNIPKNHPCVYFKDDKAWRVCFTSIVPPKGLQLYEIIDDNSQMPIAELAHIQRALGCTPYPPGPCQSVSTPAT